MLTILNERIMTNKGQFQRLLEFVEWCKSEYGLSMHAFEGKCRISNGYFNSRINKEATDLEKKSLSPRIIDRVCEAFPVLSRRWLILGEGTMLVDEQPQEVTSPKDGAPYFDVDFLGGFDITENSQKMAPDSYISMMPFNGDGCLWCNITGDSMSPLIKSGSRICMKEQPGGVSDIIYGEVYALVIGGAENGDILRTVKWVTRSDDEDKIRLVPENKDIKYGSYQDVKKSDVLKVFKVVFAGNVL